MNKDDIDFLSDEDISVKLNRLYDADMQYISLMEYKKFFCFKLIFEDLSLLIND